MDMDTITLRFKSVISKMKNDLSETINKYTKLDNSLNKVSNSMNKIANSTNNLDSNFAKSKQQIADVKKELNYLIDTYNKHVDIYKKWGSFATTNLGSYDVMYKEWGNINEPLKRDFGTPINKQTLQEELNIINDLKQKLNELKNSVEQPTKAKELVPRELIPKTEEATKKVKEIGKESDNTAKKFRSAKSSARSMGSAFSSIGKSFKNISSVFKNTSKNISKGMDNSLKKVKKFALGLIGVRTVMSLLTKSVNAYLSFDSELQDSLTNSWNLLGSLLAPAIELVANLFATATNYIYSFVKALTGIDLVARANSKALESQAKATKENAAAQRGLLSMDEITNLPTESGGGSPASQITTKDVDIKGIFSDLIDAFKKQKWHRAGEIIAEGINKGLKKIDWDTVRTKAEQTGRNIATFLNGVFELDWKLLGSSIANAINTAIDFVYGFVDEFEWGRLGAGIGDAITSFFETFDFNKLADSINKFMNGVIDMCRAAITHIDEKQMAESIAKFIERIDWLGIATNLVDLLFKAIKKAVSFKLEFLDTIVDDIEDRLLEKIPNVGKMSGKAFANAFKEGLKSVINLLIDAINTRWTGVRGVIVGFGKAAGYDVSMKDIRIPHLATGTNEIEYEGIYHLHEGEAVVPKRYNPATGGYDNGADNKQIIDLLISLNSSMLEYANRPIDINMDGKKVAEVTYNPLQQIYKDKNISNVVVRS